IEVLFRVFNFTVEDVTAAEFLCDPSHLANLETQPSFCVTSSAGGSGGDANLPSRLP
uniref:FH2 domain-containing protein n=1 Tax=Mesocestoides corti TaxID=53468 RepID=A0A5K3G8D8_MESCO